MEKFSYPIGKFEFSDSTNEEEIKNWISDIENLPKRLRESLVDLNSEQLAAPYREGGWNVRQVVHHLADSHMNAFIRFKLALTEKHPTIKPYEEKLWAEMDDANEFPIEVSLSLLDALHKRWTYLLKNLTEEDYSKTVFHPESKRNMSVKFLLAMYAWHSKHHTVHITELRGRNNW